MKYKLEYAYGDRILSNTMYCSNATQCLNKMLNVMYSGGWFILSFNKINVPILEFNFHKVNKILMYDVKIPKIIQHFAESFGGEYKC